MFVPIDYFYFLYVIVYVSLFVYYLRFFSPSNVNCIVYAHMYVHSFSYLVNKLELGGYTYLQLKKKKNEWTSIFWLNMFSFCVTLSYIDLSLLEECVSIFKKAANSSRSRASTRDL